MNVYITYNDKEKNYVTTVRKTVTQKNKKADHVLEETDILPIPYVNCKCEDKIIKLKVPRKSNKIHFTIHHGYHGPHSYMNELMISTDKEDLINAARVLFNNEHCQEDCHCTKTEECLETLMKDLEEKGVGGFGGSYYEEVDVRIFSMDIG